MKSDGDYHTVIFTKDKTMMRGIDFRAPTKGITLLVCEPFTHPREAIQAAYRVGRQNDPCERLMVNMRQVIKENAKAEYTAKLYRFCSDIINEQRRVEHARKKKEAEERAK